MAELTQVDAKGICTQCGHTGPHVTVTGAGMTMCAPPPPESVSELVKELEDLALDMDTAGGELLAKYGPGVILDFQMDKRNPGSEGRMLRAAAQMLAKLQRFYVHAGARHGAHPSQCTQCVEVLNG